MSVSQLISAGEVMFRTLGNTSTRVVLTFLIIAKKDKPIFFEEIIQLTNITPVGLSRVLKKLIDDDLVTFEIDDYDTRRKIASLTQKGKAFAYEMTKAMEDTK